MHEKEAISSPTHTITSHSTVINAPDPGETSFGKNKYKKWIYLAQAIDSWRIFPRIFITTYIVLLYQVVNWFMELEDPSMEQSGLVSVVVGAGAAWFGLYLGSSRKFKE